ncbi:hypothetical protein Q3O60_07940 [Alkalimonas collagenimarina]|uniref:Uncharacterized protein n=1 Tax=Alkalimonas collagenimarina TaxID=400390 RepID=A0ABT9GYH8_9GAMM|nr:hypothetical protein [Alkalimonas collagenimarina]MDP4536114.1 hypothetical protein [Alkalimonas collagenimarina]
MPTIVIILAVLFLALFLLVTVLEKFGKRHSNEELNKITRFIFPLVAIVLVVQLLVMIFR